MKTEAAVCAAFWREYPHLARRWKNGPAGPSRPQNAQPTDTRVAFVDFVDHLTRSGQISEALAARVTLD